jgi:hypothetical protein
MSAASFVAAVGVAALNGFGADVRAAADVCSLARACAGPSEALGDGTAAARAGLASLSRLDVAAAADDAARVAWLIERLPGRGAGVDARGRTALQ